MAKALSQSTNRSPGRHLLVIAAIILAIGGSVVGAAAVATVGRDAESSSRAAAARACGSAPSSDAVRRVPGVGLRATQIADADEPVSAAFSPKRPGDGVLAERAGRVLRIDGGVVTDEVALDLSADTFHDGDAGLLSVTYGPDGRWLYVYRVTLERDDLVTAHAVDANGQPEETGREILRVAHPPSEYHHGGSMTFGGDGMLYVGFGDGGGLGDPLDNAQNPAELLGKVVRIDPTPERATPYRVPVDNPFMGRPGWAPEIWLLGVRNPFRMSLDGATGDLWLGDVGQSCWEEIDRLPPTAGGSNLGWDRREGDAPFENGQVVGREVRPVYTYAHEKGTCAVVTGYVLRGPELPLLDGWLLFTDYCAGRFRALHADDGDDPMVIDVDLQLARPVAIVPGPRGHPWVLSLEGPIYELTPR